MALNLNEELEVLEIEKIKLEIESLKKPISKNKIWNSLEKWKFFVSLLIPILLIYISYRTSTRLNEIQGNQTAIIEQTKTSIENNKRIYDLRFSIYKQIAIEVNEIYCYNYYVGKWKELSPLEIIANKRHCDEIMYSNQSIFSPNFFKAYLSFMDSCFKTHYMMGEDAKLKTDLYSHKKYYMGEKIDWTDKWDNLFLKDPLFDEYKNRKEINKNYNNFLTLLSLELNLKEVNIDNAFNNFKPG